MATSTDNELLKEECSYLEFEINDLQRSIERADTKISILLTAIGVFLGVVATVMQNLTGTKCLLWVTLIASATTVILGVFVLWNRKGKGLEEENPTFKTLDQIRDRLKTDVDSLRGICKQKYWFFRGSLIMFAIAAVSTIVLVLTAL